MNRSFLFLAAVLSALLGAGQALAKDAPTLTIGVPEIPRNISMLTDSSPASYLLRRAVSAPLARLAGGEIGRSHLVKLLLAESLVVRPEDFAVNIRVRSDLNFSSGEPLAGRDVLASLRRCLRAKTFHRIATVERNDVNGEDAAQAELDDYFAVTIRLSRHSPAEKWTKLVEEEFLRELSLCPILEKESSELFADELGKGSSFVAVGPYKITNFSIPQKFELARVDPSTRAREAASVIELRSFPSAGQGLSTLRSGNLDVLFTEDREVLEKTSKDETLRVVSCSIYHAVVRKDLKFECSPDLDLLAVKYNS